MEIENEGDEEKGRKGSSQRGKDNRRTKRTEQGRHGRKGVGSKEDKERNWEQLELGVSVRGKKRCREEGNERTIKKGMG